MTNPEAAAAIEAPPPEEIAAAVLRSLTEDLGSGDRTAALLPANATARARVIAREPAVLCGRPWFDAVFRELDRNVTIEWDVAEGARIDAGREICRLHGNARALLAGERCALNWLQTLSGTATTARQYAEAVAGTGAEVLDTRKTIPGLRVAQKYATRVGGCRNHRMGLYDGILIKENHIAAAGSLREAILRAREAAGTLPVEVEIETLEQIEPAIAAGAHILLLDNFDLDGLREAVRIADGRVRLEASGNVRLDNIRAIAETGVDAISVGALTKHVRAIDLSMRFEEGAP